VCNCPIRRSQAIRGRSAGATPRQKIFRARIFPRQTRRHAEMPMNQGFLHCHNFYRGEKMRCERDRFPQIFSHAVTLARPTWRRKKIFAPNAFLGALTGRMRRKTRESVPK
jgi:hypothetical protein